MQPSIADLLAGPWVLLPDRLPFVHVALSQDATPQARIKAASSRNAARAPSNRGIAILPFYGVAAQRVDALREALGFVSLWHFTQAFRAALDDDTIGGILIDVDSPGGSVYGVTELAGEIYRSRARKPIFAIANSLAASGAYWVGGAASEFYVTPGGEVGSIGVVATHLDMSQALEKAGIKTTLIAAGKHKTEGNPFQPLGADARHHVQSRVDEYYRQFVAAVAKHRSVPESEVRRGMGEGRLLDAQAALRERMVDGVATLDQVVAKVARRIHESKQPHALRSVVRLTSESSHLAISTAERKRMIELLSL